MRHFDENHSLRATFQNIFNQIASMNGDAGTIDQSELEMLYQMMQKHDKNADGSINNDKNNHNYASMNNKMKNFVIIFKNEHKYLYWTIILSFILATLPFLYCLLTFLLCTNFQVGYFIFLSSLFS